MCIDSHRGCAVDCFALIVDSIICIADQKNLARERREATCTASLVQEGTISLSRHL